MVSQFGICRGVYGRRPALIERRYSKLRHYRSRSGRATWKLEPLTSHRLCHARFAVNSGQRR